MPKKVLLALLGISLSSCASVPDVPICVEINPSRGWCVNTISDKEFYVDDVNKLGGKSWWEIRPTMIYVPSSSWKELKDYLIKTCKKTNQCQKDVTKWERKSSSLEQRQAK